MHGSNQCCIARIFYLRSGNHVVCVPDHTCAASGRAWPFSAGLVPPPGERAGLSPWTAPSGDRPGADRSIMPKAKSCSPHNLKPTSNHRREPEV